MLKALIHNEGTLRISIHQITQQPPPQSRNYRRYINKQKRINSKDINIAFSVQEKSSRQVSKAVQNLNNMTNNLHSDNREYAFSTVPRICIKSDHILHNKENLNKLHKAEIIKMPQSTIRGDWKLVI